jgi:hypothetical protein
LQRPGQLTRGDCVRQSNRNVCSGFRPDMSEGAWQRPSSCVLGVHSIVCHQNGSCRYRPLLRDSTPGKLRLRSAGPVEARPTWLEPEGRPQREVPSGKVVPRSAATRYGTMRARLRLAGVPRIGNFPNIGLARARDGIFVSWACGAGTSQPFSLRQTKETAPAGAGWGRLFIGWPAGGRSIRSLGPSCAGHIRSPD